MGLKCSSLRCSYRPFDLQRRETAIAGMQHSSLPFRCKVSGFRPFLNPLVASGSARGAARTDQSVDPRGARLNALVLTYRSTERDEAIGRATAEAPFTITWPNLGKPCY